MSSAGCHTHLSTSLEENAVHVVAPDPGAVAKVEGVFSLEKQLFISSKYVN